VVVPEGRALWPVLPHFIRRCGAAGGRAVTAAASVLTLVTLLAKLWLEARRDGGN
jgi:hypothetical protein